MHIILGGTGNVGSAVATTLLEQNQPVTVIARNTEKSKGLQHKGAQVANVDVNDTPALHKILSKGTTLFLLNPPAPPSTDTVVEERKTLRSILLALKDSGIKRVVAESTYGARPGSGQGDLNVLYEMEEYLRQTDLSVSIIRAAYYMSNWAGYLEGAKQDGKLYSFFPADYQLPMVAPSDIGKFAAGLLMATADKIKLHHVEGPRTYSPSDVAMAFTNVLGRAVEPIEIPEGKWIETFKQFGFSDQAAHSYAEMTKATMGKDFEKPEAPVRGKTTIEQYIEDLIH
jgi:uncharacterized protein YbjT (DUF2867 family)